MGEAIGKLTWYAAMLGTGVVGVTKLGLKVGTKGVHLTKSASKSGAERVSNLTGKSRSLAREILESEGFCDQGLTKGGYEK